jgi:hypothetical protein
MDGSSWDLSEANFGELALLGPWVGGVPSGLPHRDYLRLFKRLDHSFGSLFIHRDRLGSIQSTSQAFWNA